MTRESLLCSPRFGSFTSSAGACLIIEFLANRIPLGQNYCSLVIYRAHLTAACHLVGNGVVNWCGFSC